MTTEEVRREFLKKTLKNVENLKEVIRITSAFEPMFKQKNYPENNPNYIEKEKIITELKSNIKLAEQKLVGLSWKNFEELNS